VNKYRALISRHTHNARKGQKWWTRISISLVP